MIAIFLASSFGMIVANFIYQFCCIQPDWAAATERSWFQVVALIGVGAALYIRSIIL